MGVFSSMLNIMLWPIIGDDKTGKTLYDTDGQYIIFNI